MIKPFLPTFLTIVVAGIISFLSAHIAYAQDNSLSCTPPRTFIESYPQCGGTVGLEGYDPTHTVMVYKYLYNNSDQSYYEAQDLGDLGQCQPPEDGSESCAISLDTHNECGGNENFPDVTSSDTVQVYSLTDCNGNQLPYQYKNLGNIGQCGACQAPQPPEESAPEQPQTPDQPAPDQSTQPVADTPIEQPTAAPQPQLSRIILSNYPDFRTDNDYQDHGTQTQTFQDFSQPQSIQWILPTDTDSKTLYVRQVTNENGSEAANDTSYNQEYDNQVVTINNISITLKKKKTLVKAAINGKEIDYTDINNIQNGSLEFLPTDPSLYPYVLPITLIFSDNSRQDTSLTINYNPKIITPTPEASTPPQSTTQSIANAIYSDVVSKRNERASQDSTYYQRVNSDLSQGRINFLILGLDLDGFRTDSIMVASYNIVNNTLGLISFPRDLMSPEVLQAAKDQAFKSPEGNSRINEMFYVTDYDDIVNGNMDAFRNNVPQNGLPFAQRILEDATGLSIDYVTVINFQLFQDLIDNQLGGQICIDATDNRCDATCQSAIAQNGGNACLGKGLALALAIERKDIPGSSDYKRAERQQLLLKSFLSDMQKKFDNDPKSIVDLLQFFNSSIDNKTLITNVPFDVLKPISWELGLCKITRSCNIIFPSIQNKLSVSNENYVVNANIQGVAITKIRDGNPNTSNPVQDYWRLVRIFTQENLR